MSASNPPQRRSRLGSQQANVVPVDSDRQIAYAEYGRPDGVPVVFLHGTPGSRRLGALLGTAAQENGVRVLAPDRPGYGRSSPWPNRSVCDAAEFITPVLDDADVQTAGLIAFSGGGPYALSIVATKPERISQVDIISGATPPTVSEEPPAIQRLLVGLATTTPSVLRGLFRGQTWLAERLDPSFVVGQYTATDDAVPNAAAEIVKEDFVEAFARHRSGAVTEFRNTATDWGIDVEEIDVDVRFWHGSNDTNVPIAGARHLERKIPSAELRVLDGVDHLQTLLRSIPDVLEGYR
ncbi:alpha/beta fold hydrolase [Natribaculum luteum]|uniref:Alpha/beta fold hydrolase n=1 Tax=Natribaculum luteum TaxID=1586232 RepID=A0ABD5NVE9_9EURY|nr:alpha/beta hydrolase [Natribaculum luteum]